MASKPTKEEMEQWKVGCRGDFPFWFEHGAKIQHKDPAVGNVMPTMNTMQKRLSVGMEWCEVNKVPCRIINLKPRQPGSSTLFIAKGYHKARNEVCNVAILGDDHNTTDKLMRMWKRYGETDAMAPFWTNKPRTTSWMEFTHGSNLTLETANDPRAGQGGTFHVLIASEPAWYRSSGHSTGEDVFSAIAACVPRLPGTIIVMESSASESHGIFHSTYQGAVTLEEFMAGNRGNGYIKFFTPFFDCEDYQFDGKNGRQSLRPGEREQILNSLDADELELIEKYGEARITPEVLAWRRQVIDSPDCGGDVDKFRRDYPDNDVDCFRSRSSAFFDHDGLYWQETQIVPMQPAMRTGDIVMSGRAPFWIRRSFGQGTFRVWEDPLEGESYILPVDWCVGRQAAGSKGERDSNAFGVLRAARLDPQTREHKKAMLVAACQPEDRSPTDIAIERVLALHRLYGNCMVVPEVNSKDNICQQLMDAGVSNIWTQRKGTNGAMPGQGKTEEVFGFLTTGQRTTRGLSGTKKQILDNLKRLVREQEFIVSCPVALHQLKMFIQKEDGSAEAGPSAHDDFVMMLAIGLFCINAATPYVSLGQQAALKGGYGTLPNYGEIGW